MKRISSGESKLQNFDYNLLGELLKTQHDDWPVVVTK